MINKLYVSLSLIGVLFIVSCSSDDDLTEKITPAQWSSEVKDSEVKILLSSDEDKTRASVDSNADGLFSANGIGVFCLATDYINPSTITIDWKKGSDGFKYSVWVDNAKINATIKNGKTNLSWDDGVSRWYPSGSWHKYAFYGYYPIMDDENISYTSTSISATIPLDGTQDVIYGSAVSTDDKAYSREYFTKNKYQVPKMVFEHKFMRLKFRCLLGAVDGKLTDALNTGIKKIEVVNVPKEVRMVIADKDDSTNDGTISFTHDMNNSYELKTSDDADGITSLYAHKDGDENTPLAYWMNNDNQKTIGQGVLVPVPASSDDLYYVRLTLVNKDGVEVVSPLKEISFKYNTKSFTAGQSYKVDLTIRGVNAIQTQMEN